MKGRIKMFNSERGFGFIVGEDGLDRFFHISSVKSVEEPVSGATVEFESKQDEKGLSASNIYILLEKEKPIFIKFGDVRIKLSNIKNYGTNIAERYFQKVYEKEYINDGGFLNKLLGPSYGWKYKGHNEEINENIADNILKEKGERKIFAKKGESYRKGASINGDYPIYAEYDGVYFTNKKAEKDDLIIKKVKYLYVTSYQNDNYTFYQDEVNFDIIKKCNELDRYFG